jgi:hypothetical protein
MTNPYKVLLGLLPARPLLVGEVVAFEDGVATIEMPDGGVMQARGDVTVGQQVYFRDGAIESEAPTMTTVVIEV